MTLQRIVGSLLVVGLVTGALAVDPPHAATAPTSQPAAAPAAKPAKEPVLLCPVTGLKVDRAVVTRFRGKWVYFANAAALQQFNADPYAYTDALQQQWAANRPLRVQVLCPVTGKVPDPAVYAGQGDDAVYFATPTARDAWTHDPRPFEARLRDECHTFQTGCATCGGDINPAAVRMVGNRRVYFCCDGCAGEFEHDRAGYLKKVDEQIATNQAAWQARRAAASQPASQPSGSKP